MLRKVLLTAVAVAACFLPVTAQATVQRTFVSMAHGDDANAATGCAPTAPCRWFATAIAATTPGGEVVVLDSGAYGAVTITQSVSLIAPSGVYGGITVFSGDGITIGTPSIFVKLKGLTINGMGGNNGVYMNAASRLVIENCAFSNFSNYGVWVTGAGTKFLIQDSSFLNNTHAVSGQSGAVGNVVRSTISTGGFGIHSSGSPSDAVNTIINVQDTVISGQTYGLFSNTANTSYFADIMATRVTVQNSGYGAYANGNSYARVNLNNSVLTNNVYGVVAVNGGTIDTLNNNVVMHNTNLPNTAGGSVNAYAPNY